MISFSFLSRVPWIKIFIALLFLSAMAAFFLLRNKDASEDWILGTVDAGTVSQIVSVSGTMDATQIAELSFPVSGVIETVFVKEGDTVFQGQEIATLKHEALKAEYQSAYAALLVAEADREELLSGLRPEALNISETNVLTAQQNLERIKRAEAKKVLNAFRTLLSTDLEAEPDDKEGDYTAPEITGTYACNEEGAYYLDVYQSGTKSGYSYTLSGLEAGTYPLYTDASAPFGDCGLLIQFTEGDAYRNSFWTIEIPNVRSASYLTNLNAYNLATIQEQNAIEAAEDALQLAQQNLILETATPRSESIARTNARVLQAQARLDQINAQIENHVLKSPLNGTVSNIDLVVGETVGLTPVATVVADSSYELTALIPEIDITKVFVGQQAEIVFDARENEILKGTLTFVSPLAREIGGVSYFEAKLMINSNTEWLRSGLNADIDIILEERENVLRIPKRFLTEKEGSYTVRVPQGERLREVPINVEFLGNDGYAAISGLKDGDTVVAP